MTDPAQAKPRMRGGVIKRGTTWSYVVRERDPETGRTKPRWVGGFRTRKEAETARADAVSAMGKGTYVAPQNVTVSEWLERWLDGHRLELKRSTAESYRVTIDRYVRPALGADRIQALSPGRLSAVFRQLHESGGRNGKPLSPRTVDYVRTILHKAMSDAVLERVLTVNPVVGAKRPKSDAPKRQGFRTWTVEQIAAFLDAPTAPPADGADPVAVSARYARGRIVDVVALAAATGMRRGELLALRWADIDLDAGALWVGRSVTVLAGERSYGTPKNHDGRLVRIEPEDVARLKAIRKQQVRDRMAWGKDWKGDEGLVFTNEDGSPLRPDYVSKTFTKAQRDLDLPTLTFHDLRHTHVTLLLRAGVPVHIVAKRAGHRDPSVTLRVYAHALPQDDSDAAGVYAAALRAARNAS